MNRFLLLFWLFLGSLSCKPKETFMMLPHYRAQFETKVGNTNGMIRDYVLVQVPSVQNEAFLQTLFHYGKQAADQQNKDWNYEIRFYAFSANTATFKVNIVNPNELADLRLDDESEDFLGIYSSKPCNSSRSKRITTFTFGNYFPPTSKTPASTQQVLNSDCD